ncbi:MAG: hypothetical protein ABJA94_07050 [Rhodoglobus sp.]
MSTPKPDTVRIRRAPKFPAFMVVGGFLGVVATFIITSLFPVDPSVGFLSLAGYFSLYGVTIGVLLGAVLAIILDRVASRRAKTVLVEREVVAPLEDEPAADQTS